MHVFFFVVVGYEEYVQRIKESDGKRFAMHEREEMEAKFPRFVFHKKNVKLLFSMIGLVSCLFSLV